MQEVHRISVRKDGLQGAIQGLTEMKEGKYNAEELIYRVDETLQDKLPSILITHSSNHDS